MTDWPHSPPHRLQEEGVYMVTAATHYKVHHFRQPDRLTYLHDRLIDLALLSGWTLQAWAVFSNHYHFVAESPKDPSNLSVWLGQLHQNAAAYINAQDNKPNRKVWHQFWDTTLTYQKSYFARLNYVHKNPVKHGLVELASNYPWCSANRFEVTAKPALVESIYSFDWTKVKIVDDF